MSNRSPRHQHPVSKLGVEAKRSSSIHLPGFTAEASLYLSNGKYVSIKALSLAPGIINIPLVIPNLGNGPSFWPPGWPPLPPGWPGTVCNGKLVNTMTDPRNCGSCGNDCGNDPLTFCYQGHCASHAGCPQNIPGFSCDPAHPEFGCYSPCGSGCVDVFHDQGNCGGCGQTCGLGEVCCGGACVNPQSFQSDPNNCGGCGNTCNFANAVGTCINGKCKLSQCDPGFGNCNNVDADGCEVNLTSDPENCGSCGNVCGTFFNGNWQWCCIRGQCVTDAILQTDPLNCGDCGHICGPNEYCSNGHCCPNCTNWFDGGHGLAAGCYTCDQINKGQAGCPGDFDCDAALAACILDPTSIFKAFFCTAYFYCCQGNRGHYACCDGPCLDLWNDPWNCGMCGNQCPPGHVCNSGKCGCPPNMSDCGTYCADLQHDLQNCGYCGGKCAPGYLCNNGTCVCPGNLTDCGGACVDLQTNQQNCGACGNKCSATFQTCKQGVCTCPDYYPNLCTSIWGETVSSQCVNLQSDNSNCGKCKNWCGDNGSCCNGNCTNLQTDQFNCGTCGNACNPQDLCCSGKCIPSDVNNCGACGNACLPGECCGPHWCYPVNFTIDPNNCGTCGNVCDSQELCCDGKCIPSDDNNCGACGIMCTPPSFCAKGGCVTIQ